MLFEDAEEIVELTVVYQSGKEVTYKSKSLEYLLLAHNTLAIHAHQYRQAVEAQMQRQNQAPVDTNKVISLAQVKAEREEQNTKDPTE